MPGDETSPTRDDAQQAGKRPRQPATDPRYPRKRSVKACHVCRARKTKCDNAQPTCGFCASLNIHCSYDATGKDHSTFDPASLEILKQIGQIISTQDDVLQSVRQIAASQAVGPSVQPHRDGAAGIVNWEQDRSFQEQPLPDISLEWFEGHTDSASTTPAASAGVAAARWFGLLTNHASPAFQEDIGIGLDKELIDQPEIDDQADSTPLQKATRLIDDVRASAEVIGELDHGSETLWQSAGSIPLVNEEEALLRNFLNHICPWLDLFDPAKTFSTRVPHLALRNAGLLNAIMALSCYHQSLNTTHETQNTSQKDALQYYYQTLHYVQKAMRHPSYQKSQELMATTLIVSTYEMLRGSKTDWQQHLKGVFWILRSRQIEVEASSLESTTWWAWLRQDIWAAFREKRRTYSTWTPKKPCSDLSSHELASRATWILAQVVNFCAEDAGSDSLEAVTGRLGWAEALKRLLDDWEAHLTVEFTPLPLSTVNDQAAFQARLIHPQCFGIAIQMHHVSRILIAANGPFVGGIDDFRRRQREVQGSVEIVCGIAVTLTEDASSMLASQCLFIAGMFVQDPRQQQAVVDMLDHCQRRCRWPTPSLSSELLKAWECVAQT